MSNWNGFVESWNSATIGKRIAALMALKGLSSHKLAPLVGVSHAAICKYRNCEDFPSTKVLIRLASALGVKAGMLVDDLSTAEIEVWEDEWMNARLGSEQS